MTAARQAPKIGYRESDRDESSARGTATSRGEDHNVVWRVEAECCCGETVRDEVDPEKLDWN